MTAIWTGAGQDMSAARETVLAWLKNLPDTP